MNLNTLGMMVTRLQRSPGSIELAISKLEIAPALVLNGLAYFSVADEERIDAHLRHEEAERVLGRKIPKEEKST